MKKFAILAALAAALLAGCASSLQSSEDLQAATAMSLGLAPADVTISNRQDSGSATNYWARTRAGQEFSCVRTAAVGVLGVTKSSPLCTPTNAKARQAQTVPTNALEQQYQRQQQQRR